MATENVEKLLCGSLAINAGVTSKEIFLENAETEFAQGNVLQSVFYQVRALFQVAQERYVTGGGEANNNNNTSAHNRNNKTAQELLKTMTEWEKQDFKTNALMQYAFERISKPERAAAKSLNLKESELRNDAGFLRGITDPLLGCRKIEEVCAQMPTEWTIVQVCKGACVNNTFSRFSRIREAPAVIFVSILRHARSEQFPQPITLRFGNSQKEAAALFNKFANIVNCFNKCIDVDHTAVITNEEMKKYWESLNDVDKYIKVMINDLQNFFYPWTFLFSGRPINLSHYQRSIFASIDAFAQQQKLSNSMRAMLSLVAMHLLNISQLELNAICSELFKSAEKQQLAVQLLQQLRPKVQNAQKPNSNISANYPCMLIVDERLDHFFWEELNVQQEFCRFNSLLCLWRLYQQHRAHIENGYLKVAINSGGSLVDPEGNLPKSRKRMSSFFKYFLPHWLFKANELPTQSLLYDQFFKLDCYVYCGHGSGLQFINGKNIAQQQTQSIVFLFGCESTRLRSCGLYSELLGSHMYYHAAKCPTLVGTIMSGLDGSMDTVATEILSRWIAPPRSVPMPWYEVEPRAWSKDGIIKPAIRNKINATIASDTHYNIGSLCAILARIHQRKTETKFYNTVTYVCRGLPAWNINIQALPKNLQK